MSIILAIIQGFFFIIIILNEYRLKSILIFLWGTLFILFGVPHFLEYIFQTSGYSETTLNTASIFVIFFNLLYLIIRSIFSNNMQGNEITQYIHNLNKSDKKFLTILFITFIFSVLMLYISNIIYFGKIFGISWGEYLNINKKFGLINPFKISLYLFFATSGVSLIFYKYSKKKLYLLTLLLIFLYSISTGNRITILPLLVSIIYPFINKRQIKFISIIQLSFFGVLSVYVMYFLRLIRVYGSFNIMFGNNSIISLNTQVMNMLLSGDGELSLKNAFYYFIEHSNNFPNFMQGHTYLRILLMPIPTSYSGGLKPPDFTISMGSAYTSNFNNTTYSMHPTLYGDLFGNFGFVGIITALFIGIILIYFSRWIYFKRKLDNITFFPIYVLASTMLIIVARGSVYNGLLYFFIGLIIIKGLSFISGIYLKRVS